jgi:hypothetical protein
MSYTKTLVLAITIAVSDMLMPIILCPLPVKKRVSHPDAHPISKKL